MNSMLSPKDISDVRNSSVNVWDVDSRSKTSAFPWRGQFTPDFVSLVFDRFDTKIGLVLDPFMGSGTVLLEALKRERLSVGSEINPAAFQLSKVFTLGSLTRTERDVQLAVVSEKIEMLKADSDGNFFNSLVDVVIQNHGESLDILLTALLLLSAKDSSSVSMKSLRRSMTQIANVLDELPETNIKVQMSCSDARRIELDDSSVGFVVTSPPYINVFNYHQNYRPSVEIVGWNVLQHAQSEIGANRKHRSNRLLTVIQYVIDMTLLLNELSRVLMNEAVVVIVVGRESKVRGLSFMNSEIIEEAINLFPEFEIRERHIRKFRSRYGVLVYEDILVFSKTRTITGESRHSAQLCLEARLIALEHLARLRATCPTDVISDLEQSILKAESVLPSPIR